MYYTVGVVFVMLLKIRFEMIVNLSEMLIGQLQVTQRD
jgi:hypothetical protein